MNVLRARWYCLPLALAVLFGIQAAAENPTPGKKSDSVVRITTAAEKPDASGAQVVLIKIEIDKGWHIYANPVGYSDLEPNATKVRVLAKGKPKAARIDYPEGKLTKDKIDATEFEYRIYEGTVTIKATIQREAKDKEPLELSITLNACTKPKDGKEGKCLMPGTVKLSVP